MGNKLNFGFAFERFAKCKDPVFADLREYKETVYDYIHTHDYPQIWYCYEGEYVHNLKGQEILCKKGSVVIVPPGILHRPFFDTPTKVLCLNVNHDILLKCLPKKYKNAAIFLFLGDFLGEVAPDFAHYRMLCPKSQETVEKIFSWFMLQNYETHSAGETQYWERLEEIFSLPEFTLPEEQMEKALHLVQTRVLPIFKIVSYLNDHYSEKITDEVLLRQANISRAVMYRYFKRVIGETYSVYLQKLRIRRAHLYMRNTTYSITQIAQFCGFYDVCHMTRAYTKYMDESPRQQRTLMRQLYQK